MFETKNIRLSLHLLKKTNIVGPSGPSERKHERKDNNIKSKWCSAGTMVSFIAGVKPDEKSMEILWC